MVDGMGIRQLREAGVEVVVGIREEEARELNRGFVHQIEYGVPWVTLKLAFTIDGFIADTEHNSKWITNEESRKEVHRLRAEHNAILVGGGTVRYDNPQLTVRAVEGSNPLRIVMDPYRIAPVNARIFNSGEAETIIVTENKTQDVEDLNNNYVDVMTLGKNSKELFDWEDVFKELYKEKGVLSVFVEGGAEVASTLINSGHVDELIVMIGPKIIGKGLSPFHKFVRSMENAIQWRIYELQQFGDDVYVRYRRGKDI
jgi:diaminohydroxyphosphoribosylaminopyrimidine deaminase/5-amino-6-(5-phosphoribosylamino)uracil reductase